MTNHSPNYSQAGMQSGIHTGVKSSASPVGGMVAYSALRFGGMGAIVGGAAAAAQVIPQVKNNRMTTGQAAYMVAKEAAGTGVATAAGAVVAGAVGMGGLVGLLAMFSVATGVKYMWNSVVEGAPQIRAAGGPAEKAGEPGAKPADAKPKRTSKK